MSFTILASLLPLAFYLIYPLAVRRIETVRPSLSKLMNGLRRRWVVNAVTRDTPVDAILSGNLMSSVSFFASTTVLLVLALFAVFGQLPQVIVATSTLQPHVEAREVEVHLVAVLAIFVLAFLNFTLSLRQFNHFCIMLGALKHGVDASSDEITTIAEINSIAARNFNNGLRAYYFSIASLCWFVSTSLSLLVSFGIVAILIYREFFSVPRALVQTLRQD
jgi:uncharacterized membrane protein